MCFPPCGPRRRSSSAVEGGNLANRTRISKKAVREIIDSGNWVCSYRTGDSTELKPYEGCLNNLYLILEDGYTKVKVAGPKSEFYEEGSRTIIMDAPTFPAVILLRTDR